MKRPTIEDVLKDVLASLISNERQIKQELQTTHACENCNPKFRDLTRRLKIAESQILILRYILLKQIEDDRKWKKQTQMK